MRIKDCALQNYPLNKCQVHAWLTNFQVDFFYIEVNYIWLSNPRCVHSVAGFISLHSYLIIQKYNSYQPTSETNNTYWGLCWLWHIKYII